MSFSIDPSRSHEFGLATPPSPPLLHLLPLPPHLAAVSHDHSATEDARMARGGSSDSAEDDTDTDDDGGTELALFALDDVGPVLSAAVAPLPSGAFEHSTTAAVPPRPAANIPSAANQPQPAFSSSHNLTSRPYRSRYAFSEPPEGAPPSPTVSAASYKRGYEQVSPSTGNTPPADSSALLPPTPPDSDSNSGGSFTPLTSATATAPRPPSSYRHSFDSQRAVASSSLRNRFLREHDFALSSHQLSAGASSTLRRRSPATSREGSRDRRTTFAVEQSQEESRLGSMLDRSKRRRPSGMSESDPADEEDNTRGNGRGFGNQRAIAPASFTSRGYAIDPVLQQQPPAPTSASSSHANGHAGPSTREDLPPIRRSRLSLPSILSLPRSSPTSSPRLGGVTRDDSLLAVRPSPASPSSTSALDPATRPRRSSTTFPSLANFRRSSVSRNSPPTTSSSSSSLSSGASSALEPSTLGTALLRPRSARARPDVERERQFDPLVSFWREERDHSRTSDAIESRGRAVLDAAQDTLRAAERTLIDAARNLPDANGETRRERDEREVRAVLASVGGRLEAADESISRTTRMLGALEAPVVELPELPSTQHLPLPSQANHTRPTVHVRVGEGWASPRAATSDDSTPSSPTLGADSPPLGTSASRAIHFLSNLRSRRPRLSRGSTGVPAPEDTPPDRPGAWLQAPTTTTATTTTDWNEHDDILEADNLNRRLLAVRQAGNWPQRDDSESLLWGQVSEEPQSFLPAATTATATTTTPTNSLLSRRLRGPTERANQLWRLGREPEAASTGVTHALRTDDSAPRLVPRDDARPSIFDSAPLPSARTIGSAGRDGWRRLDPSSSEPETASRNAPELGVLDLHRDFPPHARALSSDHSTIRFHAPNGTGAGLARTTSSTRSGAPSRMFRDDQADEANPRPRIWDHPNLPPMLPSGSAGRRVVFPPVPTRAPSFPSFPQEPNPSRSPTDRPTRFHPAFGFEATPSQRVSPDPPSRSLGFRAPAPDATNLRTHRRTTLADALTSFGTRDAATIDTTLRRRHTADAALDATAPIPAPQDIPDRTAQRQVRTERLASLRRERILMQSLLGGGGGSRDDDDTATAPRSPGSRLRHLGEFLRGFGPAGGGRFSLFDEDFGAFFGRDSAALDPRNYLDDDDFDTSYESLIRLQERLGDVKPVQGVSATKLEQLKTFKYVDWPFPAPRKELEVPLLGVATTSAVKMDEDRPALARRGLEKEERCPVCLMDYEDQDDVTLGECAHGFHTDCLTAWLKASPGCPVCRHQH